MRVLHLIGAREDNGGIVSVVRALGTALAPHGVESVAWVNSAFENLRSPALELRRSRFAMDESGSHVRLLAASLRAMPDVLRLLRQERFDLVHAHTRGGFAIAAWLNRLFGQKVLFTNHAYARRTGLYRRATKWPGFRTVVLTPNMGRHYGIPTDQPGVHIVSECGADRFWTAPQLRPEMSPEVRLVGVGNVVRWKNWHLLLEAILGLPQSLRNRLRFDLWGPTPDDADCRAYGRELKAAAARPELREIVRLRGPTNDVVRAVQEADWFVLPSTNEPCSVALIEALALGVPALVSASGGNVDIVEDGRTGLMFRPDDAQDLARCLMALVVAPPALAPAAAVRESVAARKASVVGAAYLEIYRSM